MDIYLGKPVVLVHVGTNFTAGDMGRQCAVDTRVISTHLNDLLFR